MTKPKKCGRIVEQKEEEHPFSPYRKRRIRYNNEICARNSGGILSAGITVFARFYFLPYTFGGVFSISAKELLINEEIKLKEVRVIGEEGEAIGIMTSDDALKLAYDKGYDLVLMAPQAQPPVCRIMNYGKYRYERDKKEKEAKKQTVELKEIQLSCRIDTHDFETKARHAQRFLQSGNKVRVVMRFKGREMSHMAIGQEIMQNFQDACSELGTVDKAPLLDGRLLSMVIAPIKQK